MNQLVLLSPAKLNFFLKVIRKRPDGYHDILTLFERINLCDEIYFESDSPGITKVFCAHQDVPKGSQNIVYRAASLLRTELGVKKGVRIYINKRIPVAAGLAGGSSNAATVLLGLNKMWNLDLSPHQLISFGRKVGSDVPFFLADTSWAIGRQRGDRIISLRFPASLWHILVVPRKKVFTPKVYQGFDELLFKRGGQRNILTKKGDDVNILIRRLRNNNIKEAGELLFNDLEPAILRFCPSLGRLKERLKSLQIQGVTISGSGPAIFGLTESEDEAESIKTILARQFQQVFVVKTF